MTRANGEGHKAEGNAMNELKVRDVMTHLVVTFRPQEPIAETARRMLRNRISGGPVVETGKLVGIVSEADLVQAYMPPARVDPGPTPMDSLLLLLRGSHPRRAHNRSIGDVMTRSVVSIGPDATVWEAASLIDRHGVRRLPVVDEEGFVLGIVARADLVRAMNRDDQALAQDVTAALETLGEENFIGLQVEVKDGATTVAGGADRKSTRELAIRIAALVPGILEVSDELEWDFDDSRTKPVPSPSGEHESGRDPWAVGPLVKGG